MSRIWDNPTNAKSVEFLPNGLPKDEQYIKYPRFFRGDALFVFDNIDDFNKYIEERTDNTETEQTN